MFPFRGRYRQNAPNSPEYRSFLVSAGLMRFHAFCRLSMVSTPIRREYDFADPFGEKQQGYCRS